jgi:RNA polymerase sigma factor (sigma-70 family)
MTFSGTEPGRRDTSAWFVTTHWSQVVAAGHGDTPGARDALGRFCATYWYPLYAYVRRCGRSPEDAQDLTQEFFARLISSNRLGMADQKRGRFRSFLLSAMNNFLSDEWDKNRAKKRGGGQTLLNLDSAEARYAREPVDSVTPEQIFERRWALTLLDDVVNRLRAEYDVEGKTKLFKALKPCLVGDRAEQPYVDLGRKLGLSESAVKSAVHRLRRRYRNLLRNAIAQTVSPPEEVDEELSYLFAVLASR